MDLNPIEDLCVRFPDLDFAPAPLCPREGSSAPQMCVRLAPVDLIAVMSFLRDHFRTKFEQLVDLFGVDYLYYPGARDRYAVVYSLLSITYGHRLWVKCFVNDPEPEVPSVCSIWKGAEWPEREVYDMFGIRFAGHPDLRRILTWDSFGAYPLRKDYPLQGLGERKDYEVVTRDSA